MSDLWGLDDHTASTDGARYAMPWKDWAPHIRGGCDGCEHTPKSDVNYGEYYIDHPDGSGKQVGDIMPGLNGRSLVQFYHDIGPGGEPEIYVSGIHADSNHRHDGVAEALIRRVHEDHPGVRINPGFMTDDGRAFHDRMLEKEPGAKGVLAARGGGDCYQAAGRYILDNPTANIHLVHGDVDGRGAIAGTRMGHAWIEDGDEVIDRSNGGEVRLPRHVYYALGNIGNVVRYTPSEAMERMGETEHFGPWHETGAAHSAPGWRWVDDDGTEWDEPEDEPWDPENGWIGSGPPDDDDHHHTAHRTANVPDDDPIWDLLGLPPGGQKPRSAPPAAPHAEEPIPGVPLGQERYVKALSGQPVEQGYLMLPVDVLDHYKEYDHPYDDQTKALEYMIRREGVRNPVQVSTDGTHALLHEGNHRLAVAKRLGIAHLPVKVTYDDEVVRNDGTPVPLEPVLGDWVKKNGHTLKSFWGHRTAMPAPLPQGITFHYHPTNDTIPTHMVPSYGPRWAPDTYVEDTLFDAPAVEARHNGKHVGYLEWSMQDRPGHPIKFPGEIANVHVEEPYRRHGIAEAMLDFARQHEPQVDHSDRLTDLGSMWRNHEQSRHARRTAMPYYHSTDAELNPGDEVKPASELGFDAYAEHGWNPLSVYDPDKVYFTQYPHDSSLPESSQFGKHTYEVEPIGDVERDEEWERNMEGQPEDYEWDTHDAGYYDYTAPRARVIRKIEPRKARIMSAAVTVYTQPNCVQCTMTKKQLDKLGIEHTTVDVSQDPDAHAYVRGLGYTAAPVVVVNDGEDHWAGFRPDRLKGLVSGE